MKNNVSGITAFQKIILFIVALLWALAAFNVLFGGFKTAKKALIISAFNENIYSGLTAGVSTCAKCEDTGLSADAKEIILMDIADKIGINKYSVIRDEQKDEVVLEQNSVNGDVLCKFAKDYIVIDIKIKDAIDSAFTYEKIVKDIISELNLSGEVVLNINGEINGNANITAKNMITDMLLEGLDAKIVAENRTEELYTVYAYDKDMEKFVKMGNKKVNVNISMSYDEVKNVTNVYFSTPVNNQDY